MPSPNVDVAEQAPTGDGTTATTPRRFSELRVTLVQGALIGFASPSRKAAGPHPVPPQPEPRRQTRPHAQPWPAPRTPSSGGSPGSTPPLSPDSGGPGIAATCAATPTAQRRGARPRCDPRWGDEPLRLCCLSGLPGLLVLAFLLPALNGGLLALVVAALASLRHRSLLCWCSAHGRVPAGVSGSTACQLPSPGRNEVPPWGLGPRGVGRGHRTGGNQAYCPGRPTGQSRHPPPPGTMIRPISPSSRKGRP
jgi:hypothetical protein